MTINILGTGKLISTNPSPYCNTCRSYLHDNVGECFSVNLFNGESPFLNIQLVSYQRVVTYMWNLKKRFWGPRTLVWGLHWASGENNLGCLLADGLWSHVVLSLWSRYHGMVLIDDDISFMLSTWLPMAGSLWINLLAGPNMYAALSWQANVHEHGKNSISYNGSCISFVALLA